MSDQYTPVIKRISEEYDERDSNMVLELATTDQEYADLKQEMSKLKHQHSFIEKLLQGKGEVQITAWEHGILICTKSDLVVRDIDLLKEMGKVTVSWSINTLDEEFRTDMDNAVSIERRLSAMKQIYDAGIRTVCFIAPVFPGITDFEAIFQRVKNQCDLVWLENLNLRGGFKQEIIDYITEKYPHLVPLYDVIYHKGDRSYFHSLEERAEQLAQENGCPFVDNELPYGRAEPGHPVIVDYFYHEEVRGSENTGERQKVCCEKIPATQ